MAKAKKKKTKKKTTKKRSKKLSKAALKKLKGGRGQRLLAAGGTDDIEAFCHE